MNLEQQELALLRQYRGHVEALEDLRGGLKVIDLQRQARAQADAERKKKKEAPHG